MRHDRSLSAAHLSLVPIQQEPAASAYTGRLRNPPPVYVWGARPFLWFALLAHLAFGILAIA